MGNNKQNSGPLVSVLMATYNRPVYVRQAIESVLQQTYNNFELIVVRDGGARIDDAVRYFDDSRIVFIDRDVNFGKPRSLNEAMERAQGEYVCYLDDDDMYYPHHIEVLVNVLSEQDKYGAAYSDLYKAHCRIRSDEKRVVLSKNVEVSRDFDRWALLHFNHILHVSLMHRRDLFEKTGPYNERLNVMIDWDMTRRLAFFTDFKHTNEITGEFYGAVKDSDRISIQRRKNLNDYIWNLLTIRSSRPPKPWSKVEDLSLIVVAERLTKDVEQMLSDIWSHSFYPYQIYLPLPQEDLKRLKTVVPNIVGLPIPGSLSADARVDTALNFCDGEYIAVVPADYPIDREEVVWMESALWPLQNSGDPSQAFELVSSTNQCWAAVFRREQLINARNMYKNLPVRESVFASGIRLRKPIVEEFPLQFDNMVSGAEELEKQGAWHRASVAFEYLRDCYKNELWMNTRQANALYHAGKFEDAASLAKEVNAIRPTAATLLIEGKAHRKCGRYKPAIKLLQKAENILEGKELTWTR